MIARGVHSWLTCGNRKLVLLAPESVATPHNFGSAEYAPQLYDRLLAKLQRLRGTAYLEDGAVEPNELTADGRHVSPVDGEAWHVLSVSSGGQVEPCRGPSRPAFR